MLDPHRLIPVELRPYEWEVVVASMLYAHKLMKEDPDWKPFLFGLPRVLAMAESIERQVTEDVAQD